MHRRASTPRLPLALSIVFGVLALLCFVSAPALAAAENEPVTTLTTVMQNFDAQPSQKSTISSRDGTFLWGGWINLTTRSGYFNFFPGTSDALRVIVTPYVSFSKAAGERCWTRKRERFNYAPTDSLAGVDMNTVIRRSENQITFQQTSDNVLSQVTVTYDLATLLPSRFDIASMSTNSDAKLDVVQDVSYVTPTRAPKPGRICKKKKRR